MIKIEEGKNFKDLTTFRVGGKIKYFAEAKTIEDIKDAVSFAKDKEVPVFIIGGGSDFVASDKEFSGLVIKFTADKYEINDDLLTGEGGLGWDKFVEIAVNAGLQGLECLSGIPGTVGGAPIQNIGAYGSEFSEHFYKLEAYDLEKNKTVTFAKEDCKFSYRESIFKTKEYWQKFLIVSVTFKLNKNAHPVVIYESLKGLVNENSSLKEVRTAIINTRNNKLENPDEFGNAGSFFKNPVIGNDEKERLTKNYPDAKIYPFGNAYKISAAWLIENAGLKGKELGGAAVSSKHALIIINKTGNATAREIYDLSELVSQEVDKKFGIKLEKEVQLINF